MKQLPPEKQTAQKMMTLQTGRQADGRQVEADKPTMRASCERTPSIHPAAAAAASAAARSASKDASVQDPHHNRWATSPLLRQPEALTQ